MPADPRHDRAGVAAPLAEPPLLELVLDVSGGLAGNGRYAGGPFAIGAVAGSAGVDSGCVVTAAICNTPGPERPGASGRGVERGVIGRHGKLFLARQFCGDGVHWRMLAKSVLEEDQLAGEIALIEPGEARHEVAVALAVEPVAGRAGEPRAIVPSGQGDHLAAAGESLRPVRIERAGAKADHRWKEEAPHPRRNRRDAALVPLALLAAACKPVPDSRYMFEAGAAERGRAAIERVQCGACHVIPGFDWPNGRLGPSLEGFDQQGLVAGVLPNNPGNLAAFVRDAPAVKPRSAMPAMPLTETEARDIAAYLLTMESE